MYNHYNALKPRFCAVQVFVMAEKVKWHVASGITWLRHYHMGYIDFWTVLCIVRSGLGIAGVTSCTAKQFEVQCLRCQLAQDWIQVLVERTKGSCA